MVVLCEKHFMYQRFGKVWIDQGVTNQNRFLKAFEERCNDIYGQQYLSEIHDSNICRMYKVNI